MTMSSWSCLSRSFAALLPQSNERAVLSWIRAENLSILSPWASSPRYTLASASVACRLMISNGNNGHHAQL